MNISSAKHAALGVWSILCLLPLALCLFSCTEKDEEGEYDNWRERNQQFIDSIAQVAATNADGTWAIYKAYNIGDDSTLYIGQTNYFIYVKKLEKGTGTTYPMYADSVRIHYSGRLIPTMQHPQGYCFGKSYSTNELNEDTDVPTIFCVNRNLTWFTTALIHMHEGDRWIVYVPYYLGQGDKDYTNGKIPAYSSLIMDVKLAKIYRSKIDKDTSWH
jgi:FKBP-type peptidyl-prolyl cis-trans isomerase FklB